jgi:tetratricopeptide (TPR) repeat protein
VKRGWLAGCIAALLASACQTPPVDPYLAGEAAMLQSDLLGALQAFDEVPVAHARYPEARAAAAGVERRMRRSHQILLEGLLLRSEWRDQEALVALHRAREVWSRLPGIDVLIRATEQRLQLFAAQEAGGAVIAVAAPPPSQPAPAPSAEVDLGRLPAAEPDSPSTEADTPPTEISRPLVSTAAERSEVDVVASGLIGVEGRLSRGEFEAAVADLFDLAKYHPEDLRVRLRLARILHQRALLRYGQGALTGAISDWERVLQLEPGHSLARSLLESARAEVAGGLPEPRLPEIRR